MLVISERSARGYAALRQALEVARSADARLTVLAVIRRERTDIGCGRCRQGAALWNCQIDSIAAEQLAEARAVLGSYPAAFEVGDGPELRSIIDAADRSDADVIVLPGRRSRFPRRLRRQSLEDRLRTLGEWRVVVADPLG